MYNIFMRKPNATYEFNWKVETRAIRDDYENTDALDPCDPMVGCPSGPVDEHFDWNSYYGDK